MEVNKRPGVSEVPHAHERRSRVMKPEKIPKIVQVQCIGWRQDPNGQASDARRNDACSDDAVDE